MRTIIFSFTILFLLSFGLFSQSDRISKLETNLKKANGIKKINILNDLSEAYLNHDVEKSIELAKNALEKNKNLNIDKNLKGNLYNTLGAAYFYKKRYRKSLKYYEKELEIIKQTASNKKEIIKALYNIALLYQKSGKRAKASEKFENSLSLAKSEKSHDLILHNYIALYKLHEKRDKAKALKYLQAYVSTKIEEFEVTSKKVTILRKRYKKEKKIRKKTEKALDESEELTETLIIDTTKKAETIEFLQLEKRFTKMANEQERKINLANIELKNAEIERRKLQILLFSFITLLILIGAVWLLLLYRQKRKANKLLYEQTEEIKHKTIELKEKNTEIIDSINYAKRIQDSILIPEKEIRKHLPESFIYYQPKDIVSGDFYWFSKIKDNIILAAIDCTGHGVPGAFMSMIGNTLLNEIVNEKSITKPDRILKLLHIGVMAALQQTGSDDSADDGMDMSLCTINPHLKRFQYAGAKNHLYVIQDDKLKVLRANFHSIGGRPIREDTVVNFTSYDFMYDANTIIYMMSDGYMDQFGGENDKKFNSRRLKKLLLKNRDLSMLEQKREIKQTFSNWKGANEQIDDVLIVGVKLK